MEGEKRFFGGGDSPEGTTRGEWSHTESHCIEVPEESQLVFWVPASSLECCCFINDREFLSGSDDGSMEFWCVMCKKPTHLIKNACTPSLLCNGHSYEENSTTTWNDDNVCEKEGSCSAHSWVSSIAVCRDSDLAASGAANGVVRLWSIESDSNGVRPLYDYPLEPQRGRWGRVPLARNGVAIHPIKLKGECVSTA